MVISLQVMQLTFSAATREGPQATKLGIEATLGVLQILSLRIMVSPDLPGRKVCSLQGIQNIDWIPVGIQEFHSPQGKMAGAVTSGTPKRMCQTLAKFAHFLNVNHLGFTRASRYGCFMVFL